MRSLRLSLLAFALLFPATTWAMQTATWDFTKAQVPGSWDTTQFDVLQPEQEGLHFRASQEGRFARRFDPPFGVQVMEITTVSAEALSLDFVWRARGAQPEQYYQISVPIKQGESTARLNMLDYSTWDPQAADIGFVIPAGADFRLQKITFKRWNIGEQLAEMWKSFWKFDRIEPYSINFLWGPVLTRTPLATENLWNLTPPPRGWSVGRFVMPLIILWAIGIWAWWMFKPGSRGRTLWGFPLHAAVFILGFAVLWLGFDLRMGLETISYAKTDYDTFVSKPAGERVFRNTLNLHDVVELSLPELRKSPRFVFLPQPNTPARALVRYLTYPSLPATDTEPIDALDTWLIFERPDIVVGSGGTLLLFNGQPMTRPGKVLRDFGNGSLLFRVGG